MENKTPLTRAKYGVDAPNVIRNLFVVGVLFVLLGIYVPGRFSTIQITPAAFFSIAVSFLVPGALMLVYSLIGKYSYRDRLLKQVNWRGDEIVLDVGTGKGLLMVGAAKKLDTGRSYGIDIWNAEDLTGNNEKNAMLNAQAESVENKVQVENQDVTKMTFGDGFFDVVISNLCLHNIYNKPGRKNACSEIFRVLKPGGVAVIADFKHTDEYIAAFKELGMQIELTDTAYFTTFPPLTMIRATKAT